MSSFFDVDRADRDNLAQKKISVVATPERPPESALQALAHSYHALKNAKAKMARLDILYKISDMTLDASDFRDASDRFFSNVKDLTGIEEINSVKTEVRYTTGSPETIFTLIWFEKCNGIRAGI